MRDLNYLGTNLEWDWFQNPDSTFLRALLTLPILCNFIHTLAMSLILFCRPRYLREQVESFQSPVLPWPFGDCVVSSND